MEVFFATSNRHKFAEAEKVLAGLLGKREAIRHFPFEHNELRSDCLEDIAREAVEEAHRRCNRPVFVEDSGFFIDALDGFPGTYSAWVQRKIGNEGILRLMQGAAAKNRRARFEACIAFHDGESVQTFTGKCAGEVAGKAQGAGGFGYDPIFVPEGFSQTFAENIQLKNKLSHRYKALLEFSENLLSRSRHSV